MNSARSPRLSFDGARQTQIDFYNVVGDSRFWFFLIVVIVAAILIGVAVNRGVDNFQQLDIPPWIPNQVVVIVVWVIVLLLLAYVAYRAAALSNGDQRL